MKFFFLFLLSLLSCGGKWDAAVRVLLPEIPEAWREILGVPRWRLEWIDENGGKAFADLPDRAEREIRVLQEWASPVAAYPYWDEKYARPYTMKPAGAIFPFDVSGGRITLSWIGGVETVVYTELAKICGDFPKKRPQYFDWQSFKALFESSELPPVVKADPWLVDWEAFCGKTVVSGFDRRRIKAMNRSVISLPAPENSLWVSVSPFAPPLIAENGVLNLTATENTEIYFSEQCVLKISKDASIFSFF